MSTSVVVSGEKNLESPEYRYQPSQKMELESDIREESETVIIDKREHRDIQEIKSSEHTVQFEDKIEESLERERWRDELTGSLENFLTAKQSGKTETQRISKKANDTIIDVTNAPPDSIPFEVLKILPEVGGHANMQNQRRLKSKLQELTEKTSYNGSLEEKPSLSWQDLNRELELYLEDLEPYFNKLEDRGINVNERKIQLVQVFLTHRADQIQIVD